MYFEDHDSRSYSRLSYLKYLFEHFIPLKSRQFLKYLTVETDDFSVSTHSLSHVHIFEARSEILEYGSFLLS